MEWLKEHIADAVLGWAIGELLNWLKAKATSPRKKTPEMPEQPAKQAKHLKES